MVGDSGATAHLDWFLGENDSENGCFGSRDDREDPDFLLIIFNHPICYLQLRVCEKKGLDRTSVQQVSTINNQMICG